MRNLGKSHEPIVYVAGRFSRRGVEWFARFHGADLVESKRIACLLWPASPGEWIEMRPAWQVNKYTAPAGRVGWRDVDVAEMIAARQRGAAEAAEAGHPNAMVCAVCGCWDYHACGAGCFWVAPMLCSACCAKFDVDPIGRMKLEPEGWYHRYVVKPIAVVNHEGREGHEEEVRVEGGVL